MKSGRDLFLWVFPVVAISSLFSSCEENKLNETSGAVSWPELIVFEEIALEVGALAEKGDREGILRRRTAILEAGWAVSPGSVPEGAKNWDEVHLLLGDLTSVVNGFAQSDMSDERLFAITTRLLPVVESLSKAADLP